MDPVSSPLSSNIVDRARQERGLDADDRTRLVAQFASAAAAMEARLGRNSNRAWWVPGRLEVFGKHTDYAGGRTLIATVPRGFAFVGAPRTDAIVRILDARVGDCRTFDTEPDRLPGATGWV